MGILNSILAVVASMFLISGMVYAADGDLVVNGNLCVGGKCTASLSSVPVWDYTVTDSPVTSVTSPTLDGNADGGYEFDFYVANPLAASVSYKISINGDNTDGHYYYDQTYSYWASAVGHSYGNSAYLFGLNASTWGSFDGSIKIAPNGRVTYFIDGVDSGATVQSTVNKGHYTVLVSNLTGITVTGSPNSSIGVNSRFRMWKKK